MSDWQESCYWEEGDYNISIWGQPWLLFSLALQLKCSFSEQSCKELYSFFCTSIAFFVVILASKKAKGVLHSQAHDNHWVVLIYSVVLSTKGEVYNLGGLKGPPRMLTATSVSSSCLLTSAQEGWMRGLGGRGRGNLQLGRGEVEVEEEAEAGEEQTELATPSPSQPGMRLC